MKPRGAGQLEAISSRSLDLLASQIAGRAVRVITTSRADPAIQVAAGPSTLLIDPEKAGLFDVFLASMLLRRRSQVRRLKARSKIDGEILCRWVAEDRAQLLRVFPGAAALPGLLAGGALDPMPLTLTWDRTHVKPSVPGRAGSGSNVEILELPGVTFDGVEDDFAALAESLRAGALATESWDELPDMPVATVPIHLRCSEISHADWSEEESFYASPEVNSAARLVVSCQITCAEGQEDLRARVRGMRSGTRLDGSRLHQVPVARERGSSPAIFHERSARTTRRYDPGDHLNVLGFDIHGFERDGVTHTYLRRLAVFMFVKAYETLGSDCEIVGFADQVVDLPDGRSAYLHMPVPLKSSDEPFSDRVRTRIFDAMRLPRLRIGEPACFQPLQYRTLQHAIDERLEQSDHEFVHVHYLGRRTVRRPFVDAAWYSRVADRIDSLWRRFEDDRDRHFDHMDVLPNLLRTAGRKDGYVASSLKFGERD